MADSNNILIICRDLKSARRLSRFCPQAQCRYILTSDDPRVHKAAKKYPWIDEICWIEQVESFYRVAHDVIRFLEVINNWLESLGDGQHGIPKELLFWVRHCEGGMTTQRIQCLLLLIRSYLYLLDNYKIDNIIFLCSQGYAWEDDVFFHTARSRNVPVQEIYRFRLERLIVKIGALIKLVTYEPYYILKTIMSKVLLLAKGMRANNHFDEVVFQVLSSEDKHVEIVASFMKGMEAIGYHPVAQCWNARIGAVKIRQKGLRADELEKWVPVLDMLTTSCRVSRTWMRALTRKNGFISHPKLRYEEVHLGELLWCSVAHFVWAELGQRYRLRSALRNYFKQHLPVAIKLWGGITLAEGIITWRSLNRDRKPLLFNYWLAAVGIKEPYAPQKDPTDLFLASSLSVKEALEQSGFASECIVVVGQGRHDHIPRFKMEYNADKSRILLKIPAHFRIYILFDSGFIIRGYLTTQEQIQCTCCLLDFVKENPSVALMIKPHPSHCSGILEKIIEEYSMPNVYLINRKMLPYHALNVADILIYKFSTLGYEAMLFEKPGISVILDGKENFKVYEDAAEYIFSTDELRDLLEKVVNDVAFKDQWTELRLKRQAGFLERNFPKSPKPKAELAADVLDNAIKTYWGRTQQNSSVGYWGKGSI